MVVMQCIVIVDMSQATFTCDSDSGWEENVKWQGHKDWHTSYGEAEPWTPVEEQSDHEKTEAATDWTTKSWRQKDYGWKEVDKEAKVECEAVSWQDWGYGNTDKAETKESEGKHEVAAAIGWEEYPYDDGYGRMKGAGSPELVRDEPQHWPKDMGSNSYQGWAKSQAWWSDTNDFPRRQRWD